MPYSNSRLTRVCQIFFPFGSTTWKSRNNTLCFHLSWVCYFCSLVPTSFRQSYFGCNYRSSHFLSIKLSISSWNPKSRKMHAGNSEVEVESLAPDDDVDTWASATQASKHYYSAFPAKIQQGCSSYYLTR